MKRVPANLSKYEIKFYFLIGIGGVLYSVCHFHLAGDHLSEYRYNFSQGWKWLGRKRDNYDHQWNIWIPFVKNLIPWVFLQLLISQSLKHINIHNTVLYSLYIIITGTFLWNYCGIGAILYLLIPPCTVCSLVLFQKESLVYIALAVILLSNQLSSTISGLVDVFVNVDHTKTFMLKLAFFCSQVRSVNCCIDNIGDDKNRSVSQYLQKIIQCTAYCWYLPNLFLGPHILYHKFIRGVDEPGVKWTLRRTIMHLMKLSRFAFWMFFTELMFHFLYSTALSRHPEALEKLDSWAFYGMGYCMGQYFCNKYIVLYGIAGEICRMDDIDAPPPPKCIGRIHMYSDMWKYFDRGFYEFLVRYIYAPICRFNIPLKKFVASSITFFFIYVWHGVHKHILIWTILNFVGVVVESIANSIGKSTEYTVWQHKFMSPQNARRFNCMLATPLLAISAISNCYFLGGETIGHLFIYRLFHDPFPVSLILMLILYCICQVSTEIKLREYYKAINKSCL